jgi:predicted metal-dependent hydrolase
MEVIIINNSLELENIFPINHPDKKEYLIDITNKISKFTLNYYKDKLDPTVSYSNSGISIGFNTRKNACIGICRRIPRIIIYNETKIRDLEYAELIDLAAHECAHLIYDGHGKNFNNTYNLLMDICIKNLEEYNRCLN